MRQQWGEPFSGFQHFQGLWFEPGKIADNPHYAPKELPPTDGLSECHKGILSLGLEQLLDDGAELPPLPCGNLQGHFHEAGEVDGLEDDEGEMDPSGSKALPAVRMVNDAHGAVSRGEKGLRRAHPNGPTRTGDFIFPCTGLGNDAKRYHFFMDPAGRKLIAAADLKEGDLERLMGEAEKVSFHEFAIMGVMDMETSQIDMQEFETVSRA